MHQALTLLVLVAVAGISGSAQGPTINLPGFEVRTVVSGLQNPTTMTFLGPDDFLVLEKSSGRVVRYRNGQSSEVLNLAVNNASERGLLGIARHPRFETDRGIYLFWTCRTPAPRSTTGRAPEQCDETAMLGEDTDDIMSVPLLGNRVDRFTWDGSALTFDRYHFTPFAPGGWRDGTSGPGRRQSAGARQSRRWCDRVRT